MTSCGDGGCVNTFVHTSLSMEVFTAEAMDFKTTTDRIMEFGVPTRELGEALGLRPNTIRVMRLDPTSEHHRSPPAGWESALLQLMRGRSKELDALADELGEATGAEAAEDRELAEWRARLEHSYQIGDWLEGREGHVAQ